MARRPLRSKASRWQTTTHDPARIGPLLRKAGFVGCDSDPIECRASFDATGRPRRINATYAGGWKCSMSLRLDGTYSMTQSLSMRVTGQRAPA